MPTRSRSPRDEGEAGLLGGPHALLYLFRGLTRYEPGSNCVSDGMGPSLSPRGIRKRAVWVASPKSPLRTVFRSGSEPKMGWVDATAEITGVTHDRILGCSPARQVYHSMSELEREEARGYGSPTGRSEKARSTERAMTCRADGV